MVSFYRACIIDCERLFKQDNQRDLEMATEVLSEYLERDINSEDAQEIKQKVQDKYRYSLTRFVSSFRLEKCEIGVMIVLIRPDYCRTPRFVDKFRLWFESKSRLH